MCKEDYTIGMVILRSGNIEHFRASYGADEKYRTNVEVIMKNLRAPGSAVDFTTKDVSSNTRVEVSVEKSMSALPEAVVRAEINKQHKILKPVQSPYVWPY